MRLSDFIERNIDAIVDEWAEFAQSCLPPAKDLSDEALRDHAKWLLQHMAVDIEQPQSGEQKHKKSRGNQPENAPDLTVAAKADAEQRLRQGFSLAEVLAEYRALRASVTRRWVAQPQSADQDTLSELVRFNEAVDQAVSEAVAWYVDRVDESRNLLLGMLGHDLRSPLGAARNSADYLLLTNGLTGAQSKAVARIHASTSRMRQMVDDLLDFTRTRLGGDLPVSLRRANLGQVCEETAGELRAYHPERDLRIHCSGDLTGEWDIQRMAQLVTNLGINALQHGKPDTPVNLTVADDDDAVVLRVHNQGPPIAEEVRPSLFDPLMRPVVQQAERREGASGLGLGLYIVREITTAHGGEIQVESSEVEGTTFTVRLPRKPPHKGGKRSGAAG